MTIAFLVSSSKEGLTDRRRRRSISSLSEGHLSSVEGSHNNDRWASSSLEEGFLWGESIQLFLRLIQPSWLWHPVGSMDGRRGGQTNTVDRREKYGQKNVILWAQRKKHPSTACRRRKWVSLFSLVVVDHWSISNSLLLAMFTWVSFIRPEGAQTNERTNGFKEGGKRVFNSLEEL